MTQRVAIAGASAGHSAALWVSAHKPTVSVLALSGLVMVATGLARRLR